MAEQRQPTPGRPAAAQPTEEEAGTRPAATQPTGRSGAVSPPTQPATTSQPPNIYEAYVPEDTEHTPTVPLGAQLMVDDPAVAEGVGHVPQPGLLAAPAGMPSALQAVNPQEAEEELRRAAEEGRTARVEVAPMAPPAPTGGFMQVRAGGQAPMAAPAPLPRPDDPDLRRGTGGQLAAEAAEYQSTRSSSRQPGEEE